MKKKRKLRKIFKNFIILLILLLIIFVFIKFKDSSGLVPPITYKEFDNNITFNSEYKETDYISVEDKVIDFLNLYYKSIYYLEVPDFKEFFSNDNELYLTNKALKYLITTRKEEMNNLTLRSASYDLEFMSINKEKDNYKVIVKENSVIKYSFMDSVSKYYDIENTFVFDKNYKLVSYRRSQDFYNLFTDELDDNFSKDDIDILFDENINLKRLGISAKKEYYNEYLEKNKYEGKECSHDYNRDAAKKYANSYVVKRNTEDWSVYDDFGGNCQNYSSQVIYNGGIPMDTKGDYIWKWYGEEPSNLNNKSGRSPSWTIVNDFYLYAKGNTGYGLCADTDVNLFYGEPGDIMQVGQKASFIHSIVVVGNATKDNKVIDIIVNSNSNTYENVPISALSNPEIRLIKILGYND